MTVRHSIAELRRLKYSGELKNDFRFLEINGMYIESPESCYSSIYEGITGMVINPSIACKRLEEYFNGKMRITEKYFEGHLIILVDELDCMV